MHCDHDTCTYSGHRLLLMTRSLGATLLWLQVGGGLPGDPILTRALERLLGACIMFTL